MIRGFFAGTILLVVGCLVACTEGDGLLGRTAAAISRHAPDKVVAQDQMTSGWFGFSVAQSPGLALVGGHGGSAAYLLQPSAAGWVETQKLEYGSPAPNYDLYGWGVALQGTTAFVSGPDHWWGSLDTTGWVQVLDLSGGALVPTQLVRPDLAETWGSFGAALAVDGDTLLVGAPTTDNWAGAAFVFVNNAGSWVEQARLTASAPSGADELGHAVALQGDRAVIGAWTHSHQGVKTGAAYVFERTGTTWTETHKLVGSDSALGDHFGSAVAVEGDTIVVGAYRADNSNGSYLVSEAGSAYVFTKGSTGGWSEQVELLDLYPDSGDRCGNALALQGDRLFVGCYSDGYWGANAGMVLGYLRGATGWSVPDRIVAIDGQAYDNFGWSLALEGDLLLIGASGVGGSVNVSPGAVYWFDASLLSAGGADGGTTDGGTGTTDGGTGTTDGGTGTTDGGTGTTDGGTGTTDGGTGTTDAQTTDAGTAGAADGAREDSGVAGDTGAVAEGGGAASDAGDAGPATDAMAPAEGTEAGVGGDGVGGDGGAKAAAGCDCRADPSGSSSSGQWVLSVMLALLLCTRRPRPSATRR